MIVPARSPHRRLALVVSTAPARGDRGDGDLDLERALALARAACDQGVDVGIFFMDQALDGLMAAQPALRELAELGCDLIACASSASARGLSEDDVGMLLGSQDDHAALVSRAHRVVAFT
jgi:sulfur relay (sulfurtransferase) complex TusBCD TusD component (DsrE family)